MSKTRPRPWKVELRPTWDGGNRILDALGNEVIGLGDDYDQPPQAYHVELSQADAELIVEAVNAYRQGIRGEGW